MIKKVLKNRVYLDIKEPEAGALSLESMPTAIEYAEVLEVGEGIDELKKGDRVFVKAWSIDIVNHDGKKYHFVDFRTGGILSITK